jgi:hypothetical protein
MARGAVAGFVEHDEEPESVPDSDDPANPS